MIKRTSFAILLCVCMSVSANAQTAKEQTCALKSSLMEGGAKAANEKVVELLAWNKTVDVSRFNAAFAILYPLEFVEFGVFKFGEMGDFHQRHMVIATAEDNAPIYFLFDYEKVGRTVRLFTINFTGGVKKLLEDHKFFAPPEQFSC